VYVLLASLSALAIPGHPTHFHLCRSRPCHISSAHMGARNSFVAASLGVHRWEVLSRACAGKAREEATEVIGDRWLIRSLRTFGWRPGRWPGTLSPDPWNFALFASSMAQEQGAAAATTGSPMPRDCCGARGACRQGPVRLRSGPALPSAAACPDYLECLSAARRNANASAMLLAQSDKCRGFGGRAPRTHAELLAHALEPETNRFRTEMKKYAKTG
jgi:hypothetical protein